MASFNSITNMCFVKKASKIIFVLCVVMSIDATNTKRERRELFREQVLPASGGKIPESAFRADRLSLNKLNREGFSIPDGIMLEQRRPVRHPSPYQEQPVTLKVYLTDDGRFVSIFGKYFSSSPEAIDTTYIIRTPVNVKASRLSFLHSHLNSAKQQVFKPLYAPLILPNNAIFESPVKVMPSVASNRAANRLVAHESYQRPQYISITKIQDTKGSDENFHTHLFTPGVYNHSGSTFRDMRLSPPSKRRISNNSRNITQPLHNKTTKS